MNLKSTISFLCLVLFIGKTAHTQVIENLYQSQNYEAIVKYANQSFDFSPIDLFIIGHAYFQLENDKKALTYYDKALEKGLNKDFVYLYQGLAYGYQKDYKKAITSFKKAIELNPLGQKNYTELGNAFYFQAIYDSALVYYYKARELPFQLADPYLKIPNIYQIKKQYLKALEEYKISAQRIDKQDPNYVDLLLNIGTLEYTVTKNYLACIDTYEKMLELVPTKFNLYPKLIKAYFANEDYDKGDSLFLILKNAYFKNQLTGEFEKFGNAAIDEFQWNEQKVIVYRNFKEPTEILDIIYTFFLLSVDEKNILRTLVTEKTIPLEKNGSKHLLCEKGNDGSHYTYPYGWSTDLIDYRSLKKAVTEVLNAETNPAASSKLSTSPEPPKPKKKE